MKLNFVLTLGGRGWILPLAPPNCHAPSALRLRPLSGILRGLVLRLWVLVQWGRRRRDEGTGHPYASSEAKRYIQGVTKRCRLSWLTNRALFYEPKCGGRGRVGLRGLSQWVQLYTGAQINVGDLTPYLGTSNDFTTDDDFLNMIELEHHRERLYRGKFRDLFLHILSSACLLHWFTLKQLLIGSCHRHSCGTSLHSVEVYGSENCMKIILESEGGQKWRKAGRTLNFPL
jgi:hypothetical protein